MGVCSRFMNRERVRRRRPARSPQAARATHADAMHESSCIMTSGGEVTLLYSSHSQANKPGLERHATDRSHPKRNTRGHTARVRTATLARPPRRRPRTAHAPTPPRHGPRHLVRILSMSHTRSSANTTRTKDTLTPSNKAGGHHHLPECVLVFVTPRGDAEITNDLVLILRSHPACHPPPRRAGRTGCTRLGLCGLC